MEAFSFNTFHKGQKVLDPEKVLKRKLSAYKMSNVILAAEREMQQYTKRIAAAMTRRHGGAWPGGTGMNSLSRRSGKGLQGLNNATVRRVGDNSITSTFRLPKYMKYQERGVVSTAKGGRYLTIPLPAALNSDGTPKMRSARQWQNTFVVTGKRGQLVICKKQGLRIVALYLLKPTIRIRARLGLRQTMTSESKMLKSSVVKRIRQLIKK